MQTFINGRLILKDEILSESFLSVKDGLITNLGRMKELPQETGEKIDVNGRFISPGFIDIHTHGAGGYDYMDGTVEAFIQASRTHLAHGTTTIFPTTMTSSDEDLFAAIDSFIAARKEQKNMPYLAGLHLEGPYFSLQQKGAQPEKYLRYPQPDHYEKIVAYARGNISRWSVAPELPGALEMGARLAKQGIRMSIAHSNATYNEVLEAFANGYRQVTHLYSGMSTVSRRNGLRVLGVVESSYLIDGLAVEIIADGVHLPPELLKLIIKCKNNQEICLVTDSMRGAGMPEGKSILGSLKDGQEVIIEGGIARTPDRSGFAGSVATADRLIRVMVDMVGMEIPEAVRMMTINPAVFMGLEKYKGCIAPGMDADLVIFDDKVNIDSVYVKGSKV